MSSIQTDRIDYPDLAPYTCGDISLTTREHQVLAMVADDFTDDEIIADYLNLSVDEVANIIAALRDKFNGGTRQIMTKAYREYTKVVKPVANFNVANSNETSSSAGKVAKSAQERWARGLPFIAPDMGLGEYSEETIAAANEVWKALSTGERRDIHNVLTDDVLAVWHRWHKRDGLSYYFIGRYNGLLDLHAGTVERYLRRYRKRTLSLDDPDGTSTSPDEVNPRDHYPPEAIEAAEQRKLTGKGNLRRVLTHHVLAVWYRWNKWEGKTVNWISENNGLVQISPASVHRYIREYREEYVDPRKVTASRNHLPPAADSLFDDQFAQVIAGKLFDLLIDSDEGQVFVDRIAQDVVDKLSDRLLLGFRRNDD